MAYVCVYYVCMCVCLCAMYVCSMCMCGICVWYMYMCGICMCVFVYVRGMWGGGIGVCLCMLCVFGMCVLHTFVYMCIQSHVHPCTCQRFSVFSQPLSTLIFQTVGFSLNQKFTI